MVSARWSQSLTIAYLSQGVCYHIYLSIDYHLLQLTTQHMLSKQSIVHIYTTIPSILSSKRPPFAFIQLLCHFGPVCHSTRSHLQRCIFILFLLPCKFPIFGLLKSKKKQSMLLQQIQIKMEHHLPFFLIFISSISFPSASSPSCLPFPSPSFPSSRQILYGLSSFPIIIIYKMQNNQNHGASKCGLHCFSLKPLHKDRRPNLTAALSMCRGKQNKGKKNNTKCNHYEGPIFNKDRCYATPTFIIPSEKADYVTNTRDFLRDHEKKVREYQEQPEELLIPKPRSKNMYCNVCREGYVEYIEHIRSQSHRVNVRACPFNNYMLQLERSFRGVDQREFNLISSETGPVTQQDDLGVDVGMLGRKRVKMIGQQINNAIVSPTAQTNQNYTITGSTQNLFYSHGTFPTSFQMLTQVPDCRGFFGQCPPIGFNSFFQYIPQSTMPIGYSMYCMPYPPMMTLQIFQQQH